MPFIVSEEIERYAEAHTTGEPDHLAAVAEETRSSLEAPQMMVGPLEGRFLEFLVFALDAKRVLEIGTFSGYSSLSMAAGMPDDGRIVTCDVNPEAVEVAQRHIDASPYAHMIDIRVGPALDTIATLDGPFDFVFIDADKTNYLNYYEAVVPKLADRGVIAADNVLWSGQVVDDSDQSESTVALRAFNDRVASDPRVTCVMLTVRDGVLLIRKR